MHMPHQVRGAGLGGHIITHMRHIIIHIPHQVRGAGLGGCKQSAGAAAIPRMSPPAWFRHMV